jgi:hypothetical protein
LASFESEIWETTDEYDSRKDSEAGEWSKLEVEQSRDDPMNGNFSVEKEAAATAAAATRGLWIAPENELIAEIFIKTKNRVFIYTHEINKTQNENHVPKQKSNEKFNALRQTKETQ